MTSKTNETSKPEQKNVEHEKSEKQSVSECECVGFNVPLDT